MIASGVTDAGAARPGKAAAVTHVITPPGTAAAPFAPPREGGPLTKAVSLEDASLPLRCGPCGVPRRRKMLVICVDGCRGDALMMAAPDVVRPLLRTPGVSFTFHARCDDAPVSYPSWATTFTGVAEADHGDQSPVAGEDLNLFRLGLEAQPLEVGRIDARRKGALGEGLGREAVGHDAGGSRRTACGRERDRHGTGSFGGQSASMDRVMVDSPSCQRANVQSRSESRFR